MATVILFDGRYDESDITAQSMLTQNVSLGRFIGTAGLESLSDSEKVNLARQYYLHAEMLEFVNATPYFSDQSLQIMDAFPMKVFDTVKRNGFDMPPQSETMRTGKTVVYALYNNRGQTSIGDTFELANFIKDHLLYENVSLDYDTYDPRKILNVNLRITMPEFPSTYTTNFGQSVSTYFNNNAMSATDLIELQF